MTPAHFGDHLGQIARGKPGAESVQSVSGENTCRIARLITS